MRLTDCFANEHGQNIFLSVSQHLPSHHIQLLIGLKKVNVTIAG